MATGMSARSGVEPTGEQISTSGRTCVDEGHTPRASEQGNVAPLARAEAGALGAEAGRPRGLREYVPGYFPRDANAAPLQFAREAGIAVQEPDAVLLPPGVRPTGLEAAPIVMRDPASGRPLQALESVIGGDDRVSITNATVPPWSGICALRMTAATGDVLVGTGCLINPRTVLTAGHCVNHPEYRGWMRSVEVIPGLNGESRPFGSVVGTRFRAVDGWVVHRSPEYDYGVILLDQPVRPELSLFEVAALSDADLLGRPGNIAGYPSDREMASRMFFHARRVQLLGRLRVQYDTDTYGGQSGAPVWTALPDGRREVFAVHAYGLFTGMRFNSGTRITEEVLRNLRQWMAERPSEGGTTAVPPGAVPEPAPIPPGGTESVPSLPGAEPPPRETPSLTPPEGAEPILYVCYPVSGTPSPGTGSAPSPGTGSAPSPGTGSAPSPGTESAPLPGRSAPSPGTESAPLPGTGSTLEGPFQPQRDRSQESASLPASESTGRPPGPGSGDISSSGAPASGNSTLGIRGRVLDRSGRPVPGAAVAISSGDQPYPEIAALTKADGTFVLPVNSPGSYEVSSFWGERRGRATATVGGARASVDIVLG